MASQTDNKQDLTKAVTRGAAWTLAMRWAMRFSGLISTAILARLLTPADFGIVAVAVAIMGFLDAVSNIGAEIAIIRHADPRRVHYDTVWTVNLAVHFAAALIVVALAPLAASAYQDDRYATVLPVLAAAMLLSGFKNIGLADFQRNFQFGKDFQYAVVTQIASVIVTVCLAIYFRSYWALVMGIVARGVVGVIYSYIVHPYRPRFSLAARGEILTFSGWLSLRSVSMFLLGNGERLVLAAFFSPAIVGLYAVASDLARMVVGEVLQPLGRALLPGLSKIQNNPEWVSHTFPRVLNITATISVALGVGLSVVAQDVVYVVFGQRFVDSAPLLEILAVAAAAVGFTQPVGQYLVVAKRERALALLFLFEAVLALGIVGVVGYLGGSIEHIAMAKFVIVALSLIRLAYLLKMLPGVNAGLIFSALLRPVVAGAVMYLAVHAIETTMVDSGIVRLAASVVAGGATFVLALCAIWWLFGRPAGIEAEVVNRWRAWGLATR